MVQDLGYIRATLGPAPVSNTCAISIIPGSQYRFGGFSVHGNHALNVLHLRNAYALQPGQVATRSSIGRTLENVQGSYRKAGLREVVIVPVVCFDEKAHVATVDLQIHEDGK